MAHVSWGHHLNIHKHFVDKAKMGMPLDGIFRAPVTVTEKLDGSNLGIHIRRNASADLPAFELVALLGRNSNLWSPPEDGLSTPHSIPSMKYGNAGSLGALPAAMFLFACDVCTTLGVDELIVYGEAFRCDRANASWHPFGFKQRQTTGTTVACGDAQNDDDSGAGSDGEEAPGWIKSPLTASVHQLFSRHQIPACLSADIGPTTSPSAYLEVLLRHGAKQHVVCPPTMLFSGGTLSEAIDALYHTMMHPPASCFEGAFVVLETTLTGYKFKTGLHDEQKCICTADELSEMAQHGFDNKVTLVRTHATTVDEDPKSAAKIEAMRRSLNDGCGFKEADSLRSYNQLYDIFRSRPVFPEAKKPKAGSTADDAGVTPAPKAPKPIEVDVLSAIARELSKATVDVETTPKKDRFRVVEMLLPRVVAEVRLTYEESGVACPYADEQLTSVAQAKLVATVMKIPFVTSA